MKFCKKCGVKVNSKLNYCPLCFEEIEGENEKFSPYQQKDKTDKVNKNRYFLDKLFSFISICVIAICGFINLMTKGTAWSVLVILIIGYLWILVRHTIISKRNIFEKIFLQILFIIGILLCTNLLSGGGDWFVKYILPAISLGTVIVLAFMQFISKKRKKYSLSFLIIYILLEVMSIILVTCNIDTYKLINFVNMFICGLSIIGTLIFAFKYVKQDFLKIFHL